MKKIALLNKISKKGTTLFGKDYELTTEIKGATAAIVRSADMHSEKFDKDFLAIARAGAGTNNIPIERCAEQGICVFNTPGANANAVKELVLSSLFLASRNIYPALNWAEGLSGDDVAEKVEKNKSKFAGEEIAGKTIGVVGLGAIGVKVANACELLGMKVVGYDPYITVSNAHTLSSSIKIFSNIEKMLPVCDFVTIHIPFIKGQTENFISKKEFTAMKKDTVLLNFARDKIVDEEMLPKAIAAEKIKTYITDFPNPKTVSHKNILTVPHLGASTIQSEINCAVMATKELKEFIEKGNINNSVNFPNIDAGDIPGAARVTVMHKNVAGVLNRLSDYFAKQDINISNMINLSKNEYAYTLMDIDKPASAEKILKAFSFEGVIRVRVLK